MVKVSHSDIISFDLHKNLVLETKVTLPHPRPAQSSLEPMNQRRHYLQRGRKAWLSSTVTQALLCSLHPEIKNTLMLLCANLIIPKCPHTLATMLVPKFHPAKCSSVGTS